MNKLKATIQELRDYLGSDRKGISLLNEITEVANAQRKRAAALEESSAASDALAKTLRSKLDAAEAKTASLQQSLDCQLARLAAAELRERRLKDQLTKQEEQVIEAENSDGSQDVPYRKLRALITQVTRRFKKIPIQKFKQTLYVEDFIEEYSYDEYADLGMVMAACVLMNMPVRLMAENRTNANKVGDEHLGKFIRWYADAIEWDATNDKIWRRFMAAYPEQLDKRDPLIGKG